MDSKLLDSAIRSFQAIHRQFTHPPRGRTTPQARAHFAQAQRELFHLAQVICALANPTVQTELDTIRRRVMEVISEAPDIGAALTPRFVRVALWYDFEITPGVAFDLRLIGHKTPISLARALHRQHLEQITIVRAITKLA